MDTAEIQQRLEQAVRTLMMLPVPRGGFPGGERSHWPEIVRNYAEFFAAQVQADADHREEMLAGRNAVRIRPLQSQIDQMDEALQWVFDHVENPIHRKIVFARAMLHPLSGRHIVSYRRLGRLLGMDHKAVKVWHDKALEAIRSGLERASPNTPEYATYSVST